MLCYNYTGDYMKLSIFDFDGTYVNKQVLRVILKSWKNQGYDNKMIKKIYLNILLTSIMYKLHLFGWNKPRFRANAMSLIADLFRTIEREELNKFVDIIYIELQESVNILIKEQLKKDKEEGYYTILLSGTFDVILKPFLKDGFDEVVGSFVDGKDGIIPTKQVDIIISVGKPQIIKEKFPNADFANSKAYADSYYDLGILKLVGNPIVVNPDKGLLEIAKKNNFTIFENIYK